MNILSFSKKVGTTTICSAVVETTVVETSRIFRNKDRKYVGNEIKDSKRRVRTEILETATGQGKAIPVQA